MISFNGRLILLDIEGTVSPLAFVHEVMFPFARQHAAAFLEDRAHDTAVIGALASMAQDAGKHWFVEWCPFPWPSTEAIRWVVAQIFQLMDADLKQTGLKQLQGLIWEQGFESGALRAALFEDVPSALRQWYESGLQLRIYSSGSVHAQKLFFSHTSAGDLTPMLAGYHDTTTGSKRDAASYAAIAAEAGVAPSEVLFLSDVVEELDAAQNAGMQTALAIRPGNRDTKEVRHNLFHSLHDILLSAHEN